MLELELVLVHLQMQVLDLELVCWLLMHLQMQVLDLELALVQLLDLELACSLVVALTPLGT